MTDPTGNENQPDSQRRLIFLANEATPASNRSRIKVELTRPNPPPVACWTLRAIRDGLLSVLSELLDGERDWPLYLHGSAGTGKTYAVRALLQYVPLSSYAMLERFFKEKMTSDYDDWNDRISSLSRNNLAVLDEIAMQTKSPDLLSAALQEFADARENKAAIYVSNYTPAMVAEYFGDRCASRILCGTVFHLQGDDRRFA